METPLPSHPHVLILSFPSQGHIKPMLFLAKILSRASFTITFVTTEHSLNRLLGRDHDSFLREHPGIRFLSIPDALPQDHPRSGPTRTDLYYSISTSCKSIFKDLIIRESLPTCIISDGTMSFALEVAEELCIPSFTFRTYNAANTWIYFYLQKLIEDGEIPLLEGNEEHMNGRPKTTIQGLESIIRRRDLPHICRFQLDNPFLQFCIDQSSLMTKASSLILNTFEELESSMIAQLHSIFPNIYTVGPLHASLDSEPNTSTSLHHVDRSFFQWLDAQEPESVIYVSFGNIVQLSRDQFLEFWYGLVNSGNPFLWAVRPDLVLDSSGHNEVPEDLVKGTEERGKMVGWAPQVEVLAHHAVGGFLTHSGWNSILECMCSGVPMICWPQLADQLGNSRFVSEVWKVGLDMTGTCDRSTVERMVRDLMEDRREEIMKSMEVISRLARDSTINGGSSSRNIKKLVDDIRSLHYAGQDTTCRRTS